MFNCPQLKASGRNTCCLVCLFTKSFKMLPVDLNSAYSNSCFGGKILSLWILDLEQCVCFFSLHFFISEWQIETVRVIGSCNHIAWYIRWCIGSILNAPRANQFTLELDAVDAAWASSIPHQPSSRHKTPEFTSCWPQTSA
jgi:hypothetical protein